MSEEANYPRSRCDRTGLELISYAQRELRRKNFAAEAQPWLERATKVSDASFMDVMIALAEHGGRIEVQGFGTFYVQQTPGHTKQHGQQVKFKPGRRHIMFKPSQQLRDMVNEDYFGEQVEPMPNSDFWKGAKNLQL